MIEVDEAIRLVQGQLPSVPSNSTTLEQALDHVLAEEIVSDVDSPPHDKSLVDGFAVRIADFTSNSASLRVIEEVTAGQGPQRTLTAGQCTRIMTGAPLPAGADAVVMIEDSREEDSDLVRLSPPSLSAGQHILRQGVAMRRGDIVLRPGHCLRPIDLALLAEVGATQVEIHPRAEVAILSTGDELVACHRQPGPGQIRNSNSVMLEALVKRCLAKPRNLGIAPDRRDVLTSAVDAGLQSPVLVLSGGVSAGVLDLVPGVLDAAGVRCVFHKVKLKPGKPLWFGVLDRQSDRTLVFGLPGNPISSLVCFQLFVRPVLRFLSGHGFESLPMRNGRLTNAFSHRGLRPTYHPARVTEEGGETRVETLPWKGSADIRTLADATAFACFPQGDHDYVVGDSVKIVDLS